MEMLPPTGWADVATKQDVEHLGAALGLELSAQIADGQRPTIQWTAATMIAMTGVTTAVATAIAGLT